MGYFDNEIVDLFEVNHDEQVVQRCTTNMSEKMKMNMMVRKIYLSPI